MKLKSIKDLKPKELKGKTVLLRVAYDIPLEKRGKSWVVADDRRITETVPTIKYLLKRNCKIVLLSWLKRPGGKVVEKYRMDPVAKSLSKIIKKPVKKLNDCVGPKVFKEIQAMKPKQLLMLENTRFYHQEEENNKMFSAMLVHGMDLIIFDAFAQTHRIHASTVGITKLLPSYSGFLLEKEIKELSRIIEKPKKPLIIILGGAKISDKVAVLEHLIKKADKVLIGGGVANVFFKAKKISIGRSFIQDQFVDKAKRKKVNSVKIAKRLLRKYGKKIVLPVDMMSANSMNKKSVTEIINLEEHQNINKKRMFLDIGPKTIADYVSEIKKAKTIFWNGPMGVFEINKFASGTKKVANAVARNKGVTVVGGGDTESIIKDYNLEGKFSHVSTGGGASLEFLSGKRLVALEKLIKK